MVLSPAAAATLRRSASMADRILMMNVPKVCVLPPEPGNALFGMVTAPSIRK
jgi:hypothetical protein